MVSYIEKLFPFLENSDLIKTEDAEIDIKDIYCPISFSTNITPESETEDTVVTPQLKKFQIVEVLPCEVILINEPEYVIEDVLKGKYGNFIKANKVVYDYTDIASRIEVTDYIAAVHMNDGYLEQTIVNDCFINAASNGTQADESFVETISIEKNNSVMNIKEWLAQFEGNIQESTQAFDTLLGNIQSGKGNTLESEEKTDNVYKWLDSYFALPEGTSATQGGREVVPLLIGPTGVFKSATIKELCKKYGYRLVDFRVAFTSRLDYSGLFQMGDIDEKRYSYACPMEEIMTCSDGFREFCRRAYDKVEDILRTGYMVTQKASDGETTEEVKEPISDDQRKELESLLTKYKEYTKVPVLFFDEITRCLSGDTEIVVQDGVDRKYVKIKDIPENTKVSVLSIDKSKNNTVISVKEAISRGVTRKDADNLVNVYIKNHGYVRCTDDHLWKLLDGSYKRADDLDEFTLLVNGLSVEKVEHVLDVEDVYDLEVIDGDNFAVYTEGKEVYVHNCKDMGVEGLLTEMLNQKRFNNMQMQGCKFVAATNLNLLSKSNPKHNSMMEELDDMYDVNTDIDVAYSNRFMPLKVYPEDVRDRWFEWAKKEKVTPTKTKTNIHPIILEFLSMPSNENLIYDDTPVLEAIEKGLTENETKSQSYPNYRTWDLLSGYMYSIDDDYELELKENPNAVKLFKYDSIAGLISKYGADKFIPFLESKGYKEYTSVKGEVLDEYTDFLETSLDAGVPAMMIGPSSIGKTSRVKAYVKKRKEKTGLEPVLINVDLSSKDVVDLMGMPSKMSLTDYVSGGNDVEAILPGLGKSLTSIMEDVVKNDQYGIPDKITLRAPDKSIEDKLVKARKEGREVIFMFDECFTGDTEIKLYDGFHYTFKELLDMYGTETEFWVFSMNEYGEVVPGKARNLGITRKDAELVEVKLSNEKVFRCTPDHPFMLIDGSYKNAEDLIAGDILKAGYFVTDMSENIEIIEDEDHECRVLSVISLETTEDVYDIEVDIHHNFLIYCGDNSGIFVHNCNRVTNTSVLSAMFNAISDQNFGGVDFSDMSDKVKIVAACNMAHSEMDDENGDYSSAGAIDPALAARFSVFWKKKYDEKDVKSWIAYMEQEKEEGRIDGTILEYFRNIDINDAIKIIASVEKRQLAYAEPSTRNLHQLSMDIKSMRGVSDTDDAKLFYGKLLFDDMTRNSLGDIYDTMSSYTDNEVDVAQKIVVLSDTLLAERDVWDPALSNKSVNISGNTLSANDLMDNLKKCVDELKSMVLKPLTSDERDRMKALNQLAIDLLTYCGELDDSVSQSREELFESYVGEKFAREFLPFFNQNFGSATDEEITIEMLSDKKLIVPFFKKFRAINSNVIEEKYEEMMIGLMDKFIDAHGSTLSPDVYAAFIDGMRGSLASSDGLENVLLKTTPKEDLLFQEAEKSGDAWILGMLSTTRITQSDIDAMRSELSGTKVEAPKKKAVML